MNLRRLVALHQRCGAVASGCMMCADGEEFCHDERADRMRFAWVGCLYFVASLFPAAGGLWVLMWVTDRLYEHGWMGLIAIPLRIVIFLGQCGFLLQCVTTLYKIVAVAAATFIAAVRGEAGDGDYRYRRASVLDYILVLLLPVAMGVSGALLAVFHNWLDFNEHGLGFVSLGLGWLVWAIEIGSIVLVPVWLLILPIFLWKRRLAT